MAGSVGRLFVIHKHDASRLHYDFRLEFGGVLKSWAVPKGPCLDPGEKRLAVQVEDHAVDYGSFEGVIARDEYGGGTVMLWDKGSWEPLNDPLAGSLEGNLQFRLYGKKLRGAWALVKMKGKPGQPGRNWLLIKKKDEEARSLKDVDILKEMPLSVVSGRSMAEIGAEQPGELSET